MTPRRAPPPLPQARRGGAHQALLAKALDGVDVRALDDHLGRAAGELLVRAGTADVIAAALVLLADDGDDILTAHIDDIELLAVLLGKHVELLRV